MHCHERHRVTAVVSGHGTLHTERGAHPVRPGDVLLLVPGLLHRVETQGAGPLSLLTVEFSPGMALSAAEHPLVARCFGGPPVVHCAPPAAVEAQILLHRIRAEQRRDKVAGKVAVRAYLMSLLVLLYRRRGRHAATAAAQTPDPTLLQVRAHMEANFPSALRVSDLAANAHLSPRQFTARFKQTFGQTPARYLTALRVAAAQELLCRSTLGVAEVAHAVGYEHLSHFYRIFVQHTGTSPGRYRSDPGARIAPPG